MPYHKTELTDQAKIEIVTLYTAKFSLIKIAEKYKVGVQQITETLDNAGIKRKRNKKREAKGWKPNEKRPDTYQLTKATDSYMDYIFTTMADAGRLDGDPVKNYERLIKESPFKGIKRETITKHRK